MITATPEKAATPDWERIEVEYRAGILSLRELAALHPATNHVAISRRAKKEGWTRDLSAKIKARADELVTRQAVTPAETAQRAVTEREVIEASAARIAQVRGEHRSDIQRARALVMTLFGEVEAQTSALADLLKLGEMLRNADDESGVDKLNDLYRKIISTPSRVDSAKKLVEALKVSVTMERESYGIEGAPLKIEGSTSGPMTLAAFYAGLSPADS